MAPGPLRRAERWDSKRHESGQGLTEFALVGSLFFVLLFSILNAGFFLYGRNAVEHAADVGVAAIAAEGNCQGGTNCPSGNADTVAITRMGIAGLTTTPLIHVTEIDIYKETEQSSGVFVDDNSDATCSGPCLNEYDVNGNLLNPVAGVAPWQPVNRNVGLTPDFARLVIKYTYTMLTGTQTFSISTNNLFRLEPQT